MSEAEHAFHDLTPAASADRQLDVDRLPDHLHRLFRAAYALCGSREDAEDLVQETYARVMSRPRLLRREGDLAYLLRALRNTWIDVMRSRAARPVVAGDVTELEFVAAPGADPELALRARTAYAAIAALSEPLRDTIVAIDIVGLSYKEAARSLRVREGTIMSRLYRAREQVAAALEAPA
jgi:RNA polymerase sigma-70 factor (ECF subfamily)